MEDIEVKKAYNIMKKQDKINFGEYHKTLLHIHTPASHDYRLYKELFVLWQFNTFVINTF